MSYAAEINRHPAADEVRTPQTSRLPRVNLNGPMVPVGVPLSSM
jgi:hypothetical protein